MPMTMNAAASVGTLDPATMKALPVFLVKLLRMLEDAQLNDIICWDQTGQSFHIYDSSSFCELVLPQYFKHRNLNSFVRQLNFYGFRKLAVSDRSTLCYMDCLGEDLHFMHPKFVRGEHGQMFEIKRQTNPTKKLTAAVPGEKMTMGNVPVVDTKSQLPVDEDELVEMMSELRLLRERNSALELTVSDLNRNHDLLWDEMRLLRETTARQSECFNRLVQFLISVMHPNKKMQRRTRTYVDNTDTLVVAPRHTDVLACIQRDMQENQILNKRSILQQEDLPKNEHGYYDTYDEGCYAKERLSNIINMTPALSCDAGNQLIKSSNNHLALSPVKPHIVRAPQTSQIPQNPMANSLMRRAIGACHSEPSTSLANPYPSQHLRHPTEVDNGIFFEDHQFINDGQAEEYNDETDELLPSNELMEFLGNEGMNDAVELDGFLETNDLNWNNLMELSPQ